MTIVKAVKQRTQDLFLGFSPYFTLNHDGIKVGGHEISVYTFVCGIQWTSCSHSKEPPGNRTDVSLRKQFDRARAISKPRKRETLCFTKYLQALTAYLVPLKTGSAACRVRMSASIGSVAPSKDERESTRVYSTTQLNARPRQTLIRV